MNLEEAARVYRGIHEDVQRVIARRVTGYRHVVTDLMLGLLAGGHVLLEGVPGIAKTTLAKTFSLTTGLEFRRIQFTQDLLPADVTGHVYYNQRDQVFEMREGAVFTNVLLADEINRSPPKTQSALLEAMEELQVTIEGDTRPLPVPFMVVATMNPIDVEGVYHLPEAQLDRFMLRTRMHYLDEAQEKAMLLAKLHGSRDDSALPKLRKDVILSGRRIVNRVHVHPDLVSYLQRLALATREHPDVELGASPRAMEHMLRASQALALVSGRSYVIPDDIKQVAARVLAHRVILGADADLEGRRAETIVDDIVAAEPVPKGLTKAQVMSP